jgi:hypothetical protein
MSKEGDGAHEDCLFFDYDVRAFYRFFGGSRGAISIEPRQVVFTLRRWRRRLGVLNPIPSFVHCTDPVVVISAALAPSGCWLVLLDQEQLGTAAVAVHSYANVPTVLEALRNAGFQVEHYRTNVSIGRTINSESGLELFRRSNQDRVTVYEGISGSRSRHDGDAASRRDSPVDQWRGTSGPDGHGGRRNTEESR